MRLRRIKRAALIMATLATAVALWGMHSAATEPQGAEPKEIHATVMLTSPAEVVDLRKEPEKAPEKKEELAPVQYEYVPVYVAPGITEDDAVLIYYTIEYEAGGESELGKRLATDVILNRKDDPDWPDTIIGVISQDGQFSAWNQGRLFKMIPSEDTIAAVNKELQSRISDEVVYFNAIGYMYGEPYEKVGGHYFSTKGEKE